MKPASEYQIGDSLDGHKVAALDTIGDFVYLHVKTAAGDMTAKFHKDTVPIRELKGDSPCT
jgi:hypothetical protein